MRRAYQQADTDDIVNRRGVKETRISHIKSGILCITVQTKLLVSLQADPRGACGFPAAVAFIGIKDTGSFRQRNPCFLYSEHVAWSK